MIVADSDVLIDALRGKEPWLSHVATELRAGRLTTTSISAFELLSGAKKKAEQVKVQRLLEAMPITPLDEAAARKAAEIRLQLERVGRGISMADYLIAGICLQQNAVLLTRNIGHFSRIEGLSITQLG